MKFELAKDKYLNTKQFNSLSHSSQKNYKSAMSSFCRTYVTGRKLGNMQVDKINTIICTELYDTWEDETSTSNANHKSRVFSVLMNFLVNLDHIPKNPMVITFLDAAFQKFDWRNIGLIVLMCYEWGQRPVDIRNLLWTNVFLDEKKVVITQTKRGAIVELPIPSNLLSMLTQQQEDWGYRPLTVSQMTYLLSEVKEATDLPQELQVGHLRKTAIVQMIESGVDHLAIQSVSGHKNVESLNPYNKFSLKTAKTALDRRER